MSTAFTRVRRRALMGVAILGVMALSACASGSGGTTETTAPTSAVEGDVAELSGADTSALGGDKTIKVGLEVALSGSGAFYGKIMSSAVQLAAEQIKAAGGPTFDIVLKDHKSGDAQAGVQITRELGQDGVHYNLSSYTGVFHSIYPTLEQYKLFTLDGSGTGKLGQDKPYFYGVKSSTSDERNPGLAEYVKATMPDAKTAVIIQPDIGADNNTDYVNSATEALKAVGVDVVLVEVVPSGQTDFASTVSKIVAANPDLVDSELFGSDTGYFMKQLRAAGSEAPVFGTDYVDDLGSIAGAAGDGYTFVSDYFLATDPPNEWAQYFVDTYTERYPDLPLPGYYEANYYEDLFVIWQTVQRIVKDGGDVEDPDTILSAFESDPVFSSIYGQAEGKPHGTLAFDLDTHSLAQRDLGVYEYNADSGVTQKASFQIGGKDFALTQ